MAHRSLFRKFMGLFSSQKAKRGGSTLSASQAIDMQNAYIQIRCMADTPLSPPYPEIIKQLYLPQTEVVVAALYYLQKIAAGETAETEGIAVSMQNILKEKNRIPSEHKFLIRQALATIQKNI